MIKSKKLSKIKDIQHGFFNSIGGKSKNIYKSLNCGPGSNDKKINVKKNLEIVKYLYLKKNKLEITLFYLRNIINEINNLTGDDLSKNISKNIFSKFCVGK
jgi:tRNA U34 5-carboxymethylaminomethyl modifying GTPase MnmE/TrmE